MPAQSSQHALRPARPPSTPLSDLLDPIAAQPRPAVPADLLVTGIEQRSDAVLPGDLFAALPGSVAHGARFAEAAVQQGAVAVLTDPAGAEIAGDLGVPVLVRENPRAILGEVSAAIYGNPSERLQIIGITGTSGKTTTSYLVEAGLAAAGRSTALIGTIETRIGGHRIPSALTTPEAPQLHAVFALMVEQGVDAVVMEVSSHALALGRVDGVRFTVGAFTNLSQDHLDFHADFEDYFAAKRRLFEADSPVAARIAVVNIDDAWGRRLADGLAEPVRVATTARADWSLAGPARAQGGQQEFTAIGPEGETTVRLGLPGDYNVANGLLALAVCAVAGAAPETVAPALAAVDVPGRMQRVERGQEFLALVDYAHKPAAVESVIATLRAHLHAAGSRGRLAVVVGAGGDRDAGKRRLMGAAAARGADLLIVTDDNPRTEDPATIRSALVAGAHSISEQQGGSEQPSGEVRDIGDRSAAIEAAVRWARAGDVVLVAGKGHEVGQEIHGVKYPFDDREVLSTAIDSILRHSSGGTDNGSWSPGAEDLTVS